MKRSPSTTAAGRAKAGPSLSPPQLQAFLREAAEHRVAGRFDQAIAVYAHVEQRNPDAYDAPYFLALIDLARGRTAAAALRLEALTRRIPNDAKVWSALGLARRELGQWTAALDALDRARAIDPSDSQLDRVNILEVLGRIDEAAARYRQLAAEGSDRLMALSALAHLRPGEITADERAEMAAAAQAEDVAIEVRIRLFFALGEIEEKRGDTDAAFTAFAAGNRLKRRTLTGEIPPPPRRVVDMATPPSTPAAASEAHRLAVAFHKAVFTREFIAAYEGRGHHSAAPIFVVGMPRSGSTLVEQILSSHRRVQGMGETAALAEAVSNQYPLNLFAPNPPDHFRAMAEAYFKAVHARGWTNAPRFVDKSLRNYGDIGLIHLMLPKAVILHSVRDPVDTCLACYRKSFQAGHEASYDLADIGREYVRYREMMDHWAQVLPGRVIDVGHEALVADPEPQIRWLVTEACGLDWDPACLRFYESKRPVRTASVAQVRQPIFTTSIERWRRYEKHLGPLFEALGPYAPADVTARPSSG